MVHGGDAGLACLHCYLPGVGIIWVKKGALRQGVLKVPGQSGAGKCLVVRSPVVMQGLLACIAL